MDFLFHNVGPGDRWSLLRRRRWQEVGRVAGDVLQKGGPGLGARGAALAGGPPLAGGRGRGGGPAEGGPGLTPLHPGLGPRLPGGLRGGGGGARGRPRGVHVELAGGGGRVAVRQKLGEAGPVPHSEEGRWC